MEHAYLEEIKRQTKFTTKIKKKLTIVNENIKFKNVPFHS